MRRPAPRHQTQRRLEAARPVDPPLRRVGLHPMRRLPSERLREPLLAGQPVGLAQDDHPLVAVQLPDHLAVPRAGGIQRIETAPVPRGGSPPRHGVEVPVDRVAEPQPAVSQEIEAPGADRFGGRQQRAGRARQAGAQDGGGRRIAGSGKEAVAHRLPEARQRIRPRAAPSAPARRVAWRPRAARHAEPLEQGPGRLAAAHRQLVDPHARQAPPLRGVDHDAGPDGSRPDLARAAP